MLIQQERFNTFVLDNVKPIKDDGGGVISISFPDCYRFETDEGLQYLNPVEGFEELRQSEEVMPPEICKSFYLPEGSKIGRASCRERVYAPV